MKFEIKSPTGIACLLLLLVTLILSAVTIAQSNRIHSLEAELARKNEAASRASGKIDYSKISIETRRKIVKQKITCGYCKGEGKQIIDLEHKNDIIYGCPVCRSRGHNIVTIDNSRNELCENCAGMGSVGYEYRDDNQDRIGARICTVCQGRGWTKSKS